MKNLKIVICISAAVLQMSICNAAKVWYSVGGEGIVPTSPSTRGTIVYWSVYQHYSSMPGMVGTSPYSGCDCTIYRDGVAIATVKSRGESNYFVDTGTVAGQTCAYQVSAMGDTTSVMYRTCYFSVDLANVTPSNFVFDSNGGTKSITISGTQSIYSDVTKKVTTEKLDWSSRHANWLSISRNGDQLIMSVDKWTGSSARTGLVEITAKGNVILTVEVKQESSLMPELPEGASDAEVRGVMSTFADTKIKNYIVDYDAYNNFRTWVKSNAIDYNAVKDSPHAWLSYALNTASLIAKEVKAGDVVIENFKKWSKPGVFDFTVSVKDISIGDDALEENIKKVFGIEGSTSLKSELFSPDLLRVKAVALESGKVRFTVEPNDITAKSFFFKVKMLR